MLHVPSIETDEGIILSLVEFLVGGNISYVVNILSVLSSVEKDVIRVLLRSPSTGSELEALFTKADLSISLLPLFRTALTITRDLQKVEGPEITLGRWRRAFQRILTTHVVASMELSVGALDRLVGHLGTSHK